MLCWQQGEGYWENKHEHGMKLSEYTILMSEFAAFEQEVKEIEGIDATSAVPSIRLKEIEDIEKEIPLYKKKSDDNLLKLKIKKNKAEQKSQDELKKLKIKKKQSRTE